MLCPTTDSYFLVQSWIVFYYTSSKRFDWICFFLHFVWTSSYSRLTFIRIASYSKFSVIRSSRLLEAIFISLGKPSLLQIQIPTDRTSGTRTCATQMLTTAIVEICSTPLTTAPRWPFTCFYAFENLLSEVLLNGLYSYWMFLLLITLDKLQ